MLDPHDLKRFIDAQGPLYVQALDELRAGAKRSHWMWFIFPQLSGLGRSATAQRYGISGRDEALAYLQHPVLGPRLEECLQALLAWRGRSARQLLGTPDDQKLRSCVTLFGTVAVDNVLYSEVLDVFFGGQADPLTLAKLASG